MKKYLFIISLVFLLFFSFAFKVHTENSFPLFGRLIVLDPGHGGLDPGSLFKNEYEKDYNLLFSKTLAQELEKLGATVITTRDGDYDLSNPSSTSRKRTDFNNRIKLIDESGADLYISLHMNYLNNSKYYGSQVFFSNANKQNKIIADLFQSELNEYFGFNKSTKKIGNDKYMYQRLKTKGILIEYGFMSSYRDRNNLKKEEYRKELAEIISRCIIAYYST